MTRGKGSKGRILSDPFFPESLRRKVAPWRRSSFLAISWLIFNWSKPIAPREERRGSSVVLGEKSSEEKYSSYPFF